MKLLMLCKVQKKLVMITYFHCFLMYLLIESFQLLNYNEITPSIVFATSLYFAITVSGFFIIRFIEMLLYFSFLEAVVCITAPTLSKSDLRFSIFFASVFTINLYKYSDGQVDVSFNWFFNFL